MLQPKNFDESLPLEWEDGQPVILGPLPRKTPPPVERKALPFFANIYDAFAYFLRQEVASGNATQDTVEAYHREVGNWIKWCEARQLLPEEVQPFHLEAFREELKRRGLSIPTRAYKLSIIRRFYESAVYAGLREDNPAVNVWAGKDPTSPEDKMKILSEEALSALVHSLPVEGLSGLRDRAIVALMAAHGLRRVEIQRLSHSHVITLEHSDARSLMVDGRGHKVRRVFLRDDTWKTLEAYFQEKARAGYELQDAIFVGHGNNGRGHRLSRVSINAIVDKYLNAAHLKSIGVSCHALRHTFGTVAVANGADLEDLRIAMGHGLLETTSNYVKAVQKGKENPAFFINVEF
jgi:site-specific recombinase XerD